MLLLQLRKESSWTCIVVGVVLIATGVLWGEHSDLAVKHESAMLTERQAPIATGYDVIGRFEIPQSGTQEWDDLAIDSEARRLYVTHGDRVEVLNADSGKVVGRISGLDGARGIELVSELHRGFVSNCARSSVTIFDTNTLRVMREVNIPDKCPDGVLYDDLTKRLFVTPKDGKVSVLDAQTGDRVGIVDVHGSPEDSVSDDNGRVYVNVFYPNNHNRGGQAGAVVVIDAKSLAVTETYADVCSEPKSLLYDSANRRLLIGCTDVFVAFDVTTGHWVGKSIVCGDVDGAAFDPETKLIFESCGEGVVSIIQEASFAPYYRLVATIPTRLWARTMAFDPKTKRIYLPSGVFEYDPTNQPPAHGHTKPGSFAVLVLGRTSSRWVSP